MRDTDVRFFDGRRNEGRTTGLGVAGLRTTGFLAAIFLAETFFFAAISLTARLFALTTLRPSGFFVLTDFAFAIARFPCRLARLQSVAALSHEAQRLLQPDIQFFQQGSEE